MKPAVYAVFFSVCFFTWNTHAYDNTAITNVRASCGGLGAEIDKLKKMAGINTAITGVGTVAGVGATVTGFVKKSKDAKIEELQEILKKLTQIESENWQDDITARDADMIVYQLQRHNIETANKTETDPEKIRARLEKLDKQSKNLGNWRTGLAATSTVTNVAGAIIAGNNRADDDIKSQINQCLTDIDALKREFMQARLDNNLTPEQTQQIQNIVDACDDWSTVDLSSINSRATGAMISSIAGATLGAGATVTSALANTKNIREKEENAQKEKDLNNAANILSIGTTAASLTATVFNATQISAIKRAANVSDKCIEALQ